MKHVFYINRARLTDSHPYPFDWEGLCFSLLMGDYKNDKVPRYVAAIFVSTDEKQLLGQLQKDAANNNADVYYLVGFSHEAAAAVKTAKDSGTGKFYIVNQPRRKHPAALVALADEVKRIKTHHLHMAAPGPSGKLLDKIMPKKRIWRDYTIGIHFAKKLKNKFD